MGCCNSRQSSSPPSDNDNNAAPQPSSSASHASSPRARPPRPEPSPPPLNPLPVTHKILRPETTKHYEPGSSTLPPLTRKELDRQRVDYFDTGVGLGGSAEIWATLQAVCEEFRNGNIAEASAILAAAGCTCPTGNLWGTRTRGGVFDDRGEWYAIPDWCLGDPEGVIDNDSNGGKGEAETAVRNRGKAPAKSAVKPMKVRTRLSHVARDIFVAMDMDDPVRDLVERVREIASLPIETRIKISYLGTILREDRTLISQGWREGQVINAYVFLSQG